ncbi:hypothetical protein A5757_15250 [Mycobacterium sp. 852013-51886_SCH5428379]|uniref:hypothetical protein n=1 Tax=Mycobacterium sp. 852013-51886_SCH5428379 TaxID=1834111 RepID=UPI0008012B09|nr:hypothetical protein [Mycobacterium sp. 852013-51886_SCH5428379]OBB58983.1 hypothetical protein A5757_15250 [Mycobacterium sp. 852013-51886_SCH5428379]
MKLVADRGLWSTGPQPAATPLVAVLEVSGAVLTWTVDSPADPVHVTFTDVSRADWLWRVVGEAGHVALAAALDGPAADGVPVDVAGVQVAATAVAPLRRLGLGHWLRRWWPESRIDGTAGLDRAVLDAELALLTAAADDYFTDDTIDSDAAGLLGPHLDELEFRARLGDPRLVELARRCADLADDLGIGVPESAVAEPQRRDDYALVAGDRSGAPEGAIATGAGAIAWGAVPPGVFDAAERSLAWSVHIVDGAAVARVRAALLGSGSAAGLPVRVTVGNVSAAGVLDDAGRATVPLADGSGGPLSEAAAWNQDWTVTTVTVGAASGETPADRERVRRFARARLVDPGADAYLTEILAAESDY